jgi:hypothetical protein
VATPPRSADNQRFETGYDAALLVEAVRVIARHANPADPEAASPKSYEAARAPAGHPSAPGARATRRALGNIGWYQLLHLAFHDERSLLHNVAVAQRPAGRPVSTQEATVALRIVAARLRADTLRPHEYRAELEAMQQADPTVDLPTEDRIEVVLKTDTETGWDRGLRLAGLAPRTAARPRAGLDATGAVEMFLADVGCFPWDRRALEAWAKLRGASLVTVGVAERQAAIDALRAKRRAAGLWAPDAPPPLRQRPPINPAAFTDWAPAAPRRAANRGKTSWTDNPERVIGGLVLAYDIAAERRLKLTQKAHRQLAREFPGEIPAPDTVNQAAKKHGTSAAAWREEAIRRRARR